MNRFILRESYLPAFLNALIRMKHNALRRMGINAEVWGRQFLTQAYRRETKTIIKDVEDPRGPTIEVATLMDGHWKMDDTMYENLPKIMWSQLVDLLEATHVQEERHRTQPGAAPIWAPAEEASRQVAFVRVQHRRTPQNEISV